MTIREEEKFNMASTIQESVDKPGRTPDDLKIAHPALSRPIPDQANVLLLGGEQPALRGLYALLRTRAKVTLAEDLPSALEKMTERKVQAVFCAACFHCGSWTEAVETIGFLYPDVPVVIVNEASQNQTFAEHQSAMFLAGAFDVLQDPQDELGVMVVLAHALASGEARQWQVAS